MSRRKRKIRKYILPSTAEIYERSLPIDVFNLPDSIKKHLIAGKVDTVGKLYRAKKRKLMKIKGIGPKTAGYLRSFRKKISLSPVLVEQNQEMKSLDYRFDLKDPIEILGLPIRIENALKKSGIRSLRHFYYYPEKKFYKIKNIGPKTQQLFIQIKRRIWFGELEEFRDATPEETLLPGNLYDLLLEKAEKNSRNMEILVRRYGLINGERETLEEIGKTYGITRERVRQIQAKALKKLKHPSNRLRHAVKKLVEDLIFKEKGVISDQEADLLIPKVFGKQGFDGSSFLDLLGDCSWIQTYRLADGDISFYSPVIENFRLSSLVEQIYSLLSKKFELLLSLDELEDNIELNLKSEILIKRDFILKICRIDPRIEEKTNGKFRLFSNTVGTKIWVSLIKEVLEENDYPLHFTEIAELVNRVLLTGNKLDPRRAHSILIENPEFAHTGIRGTYGLTKWGLRKESTVDLAKEFIKNAGFPVHWKQIYDYVSRYKDSPKQNILSILELSGKFKKKGRGFYDIKKYSNH